MRRALAVPAHFLSIVVAGTVVVVVGGTGAALAATTVDLGTAGAFAVLAGSGITNTGQSTITGDIGTSPTPAETGVDPCPSAANCVFLTGSNHPADATALQAKQDQTTAYNAAAGQSADQSLGADLGGLTFTTGVYNAAGSLGLTGEVTLDAQNVDGAVFIFQIGSSLVTASASSVRLVNGASACNVFFQVGSAATLGTGSTFQGTILAHDDISLGDAVTVDGRLLGGEQASGAGAVTLIHNTIATPNCTAAGTTGGTTGGTGGTTGGTGGTTGGTGGGTSGTGGTTSGTSGTGGTTSGTSGTGGTTSGTSGGTTGGTDTLPFSGAPTGAAALLGLASVLGGALLLFLGRRPGSPTTQQPSATP